MALDLSQSPYFDDYDASKNYHRVLFTPGRAVQARELNQLQTILQEQIKRFGNHVFKNGSMVIPGENNYDLNYEFVTIQGVNYADISEILETNDVTITGRTSGVVAQLKQYQPNVGSDPITFYLQYLNGSEDGTVSRFVTGEVLELVTAAGVQFALPTCVNTGVGSVFTVKAGVFYINGFFIETDSQSIIMSRYSNTPTVLIGFRLHETAIDYIDDNTLLDAAGGFGNINAIGADRLKLTLELEAYENGATYDPDNFIEIASFKNGVLQKLVQTTDYSVLEDTLARRTYDQSGDYTVNAFGIDVREHLDTGSNGGLYPVSEGGDSTKFAVGVEAGKAYVRGYEIENLATQYLDVDKARDFAFLDNSTVAMPLGAYIEATAPNITPKIGSVVQLYSTVISTPGSIPSGTLLGSGYLISVGRQASGTIRLYLVHIRDAANTKDTSFIANVKSAYIAGSPAFTSNTNSVLQDPSNNGLLYRLPVSNVKTLLSASLTSDTSMIVTRQITATSDTSGNVILTAGTNEVFIAPTDSSSFVSYDTSIVTLAGSNAVLGGSPTGKTMTLSLGSGAISKSVTATVQVAKQTANYKTKTLTTASITLTPADIKTGNIFFLAKADVIKINSVTMNSADIKAKFTLVRNANPDVYGISYIKLNNGESVPTANITVNFNYFIHGTSGDFFSVDSYTVPYEDIPMETVDGVTSRASDFLDFRPRKPDDNNNNFTGTGFTSFEVPTSNSLLRADVNFYLARIDKVYVNSKGTFGTTRGVPAIEPKEPKTPDNSMLLYILYIPAYTISANDVQFQMINNRRYTMRDIGGLETRIANLEYYTTLSLLETETSALQIVDSQTGQNRFKNGFVVDAFTDLNTSLSTSADSKCSIDPYSGTLRPDFFDNQIDMAYDPASGTVLTGSLVTLPYTEVVFLSQTSASDTLNVNPYAVYRWYGEMKLTPNSDTWTVTQYN